MPSAALKAHVRARRAGEAGGALVDPAQAAQLLHRKTRPAARGLPTVGRRVLALVRPLIRGSGASVAELNLRWRELAGARLARICQPKKLLRSRAGTVLVLEARGGAGAALAELEGDALMARINGAFGRGFIARLRIYQGRIGAAKKPPPERPAPRVITPAERAALEAKLARLPEGGLRQAARALGLAVLAQRRNTR